MTAALGTLPFIATLWLLMVLGASLLEESGAKIAAALKGVPPQPPVVVSIRSRNRARPPRIRTLDPRWRAAA